ncbi:tetratricopeptide repeat protein [Saccharopolyspora mangrovi]|uniref:Tetratricopeptide repeat protein n=1 Tax=Saccharopolyspora mangrovi TaxID=3082379 RepID=A0ABU6AK57_9PSEU|nr:tetratricopeptide repeat protein [Saccharopolyspora sp. S2-29]MEB3371959.1 tetratricopeptide repeat protein [Saccharopolyspora sp. S2-29]
MHAKAAEYRGGLAALSVNASLDEVLEQAEQHDAAATTALERAGAQLAIAEACRRLGRVERAERAWRASYRTGRDAGDAAAMAWALWSGGTLARQRGRYVFAHRLLSHAAATAERGTDRMARGYALAGLAETGRVQGDFAGTLRLHEQLLGEARADGQPRHVVWALEGIAQIHRHHGDHDTALALFTEACEIATQGDDQRGRAWALRGIADLTSLRGDVERALELLADAEETCREMRLEAALAYNHKMRGNVLYRAARYAEAEQVYRDTIEEFTRISEPRGEALARLGLVKSQARQGASPGQVDADLRALHTRFTESGLHHAADMAQAAHRELVGQEKLVTASW